MGILLDGGWGDFGNILAAVSAVGTAAFGLVDATKVYQGGISNVGLGFIITSLKPYEKALQLVSVEHPYDTIRANWLNGLAKADQKATVKSLIRLGLTQSTVLDLAKGVPGVDSTALQDVTKKIDSGKSLSEEDINVLGRFDAIVEAQMDAAFERADQLYRNSAKVLAAVFALLLSVIGVWAIEGSAVVFSDFMLALLIGVIATPVAPVAKDISSAVATAVTAFKSFKG